MKKFFPDDYDFVPGSWILPAGYASLRSAILANQHKKKRKTYIVKPPNSSQGQGIYLLQSHDELPKEYQLLCRSTLTDLCSLMATSLTCDCTYW
jgi:tubulin polyglutamylase TTLL7